MPQGKGTYGNQVGRPPKSDNSGKYLNEKEKEKDEIKGYQRHLADYGLYKGKIDGIFGNKTITADSLYKELVIDKDYSKGRVFRHLQGFPDMTDEEWVDYIATGKIMKSMTGE